MADIVVWQDMANDDAENLNVQDGPATPTTRPAPKPDDPVQGDDEAAKKTKSEKKRRQKAKKAAEVREFKEKTTYQQIEIVLNDAVPNGALYENEKHDLVRRLAWCTARSRVARCSLCSVPLARERPAHMLLVDAAFDSRPLRPCECLPEAPSVRERQVPRPAHQDDGEDHGVQGRDAEGGGVPQRRDLAAG